MLTLNKERCFSLSFFKLSYLCLYIYLNIWPFMMTGFRVWEWGRFKRTWIWFKTLVVDVFFSFFFTADDVLFFYLNLFFFFGGEMIWKFLWLMQPANGNALSTRAWFNESALLSCLFCQRYGKKFFPPICFLFFFFFPSLLFILHPFLFSYTVTILDYNLVWFYLYLFVYNFFPFHDDDGIVRQLVL